MVQNTTPLLAIILAQKYLKLSHPLIASYLLKPHGHGAVLEMGNLFQLTMIIGQTLSLNLLDLALSIFQD